VNLCKELAAVHARWAPVDERVREIQENIKATCGDRLAGEGWNRANERQVERLITRLREEFPGRVFEAERGGDAKQLAQQRQQAQRRRDVACVLVEKQRLSRWALRTTRWNYVFTVPGESPEALLLVAHYDTWRGPGADDNTTGEEILKQYLLADLRAASRPRLTHVYFFAGSEECGLVGLASQLLLSAGLIAAIQAWQRGSWEWGLVALALCPLASYRFGVSGSREYVQALAPEELDSIRAVVSVDSVGEGRMFIPRSTLGADFIRALIPFGHYDAFTDVLEEGAHLHGIKYNNYLAGGTTDHLSFLEVNNGLWCRVRDAARRVWAWLSGREYRAPRRIPATALVAMRPGKASPVVFGGKIHTKADVPERVYDEPLRESLLILDYTFHIVEGGARLREPRRLEEFHYARLYEISRTGDGGAEYWLAAKDALEPNRRNLNAIYRANAEVDEAKKEARVRVGEALGWGVETRLRNEVVELCRERGKRCRRVRVDRLTVTNGEQELSYARRLTALDWLRRYWHRSLGALGVWVGRYSFIAFLLVAYGVAWLVATVLNFFFFRSFAFQELFFTHQWISMPLLIVFQLSLLAYLMARAIPTWIDDHYRHENRDDNLGSLRRVASSA